MAAGKEHGKVGGPEKAGEVNNYSNNYSNNNKSFTFFVKYKIVYKNFLFFREHMEVENSRIKRQLKYLKEMVVENEEVE